jgi:hypothetical protein
MTMWWMARRCAAAGRRPTRYFGNAASVLVGDFLYSRSFQMMVSLNRMPIMKIMGDATNAIAEGEVLQLMNAHDPDTTEARYLDVIYRKTARLFQAAAQIGAVVSDAPPLIEESCRVMVNTSAPPSNWSTTRWITRPTKPRWANIWAMTSPRGNPLSP